jgi:DNA replication and repair protein RecF
VDNEIPMTVLSQLTVRDFRNITRADLQFPAKGVAVVGENGHGKTNLLEAIYYLQILRSMRGARDQELIRFDAPAFYLAATIQHANTSAPDTPQRTRTITAGFERTGKRKKVTLDNAPPARLSDALGALPSVVISPRDVELIIGAPSERRRFLDVILALTSHRYLVALQTYRSALARRNSALRNALRGTMTQHEDTVAVWEPTLAHHGATLLHLRASWLEQNAGRFADLCRAIGEQHLVQLRYTTNVSTPHDAEQALLDALARKRSFDLKRGVTHVGPHRDDLHLLLGGHDLKTFGSAGQQRTAAIALRMLEAATLREHIGSEPVLLLDDPFAELDVRRSAHILSLLTDAGLGQTIFAVPRKSDIPRELTQLDRWQIRDGVITPAAEYG